MELDRDDGKSQSFNCASRMKWIRQQWLDVLYRLPVLTFVLMVLSFFLFGYFSVNLFVLLKANIDLILEYGYMALEDGAAQQLVELLFTAYLSVLFFLCFKVCERVLVDRITRRLNAIKAGRAP